jgi:hypothetical protein
MPSNPIQQIVTDPDFAKLSADDQQAVLAHFDPDFGQLGGDDFTRAVNSIRQSTIIPQTGGLQGAPPTNPTSAMGQQIRNAAPPDVVTPKQGESFSDTMQRAVAMGKQVTPSQIANQTATGLIESPLALGATPVIGAAGAAGLAGAGEASAGAPQVAKAIGDMAKAHPEAAKWIAKVAVGGMLGQEVGHPVKGAVVGALLKLLLK